MAGEVRRHPDPEYLLRPAGVPVHEITTRPSSLPESLQRHLRALVTATEVASIGELAGTDEAFLLGEVGDVVLSGGHVYVLDVQAQEVRIFTATGAHLTTFGGPGQGPGEFVRPVALTIGPETENAWVADEARRLTQYALRAAAPRYVETMVLEAGVQDTCFAADDTIVALGLLFGENEALQRLTTDGRVTATFGHKAYASPSFSVNLTLNDTITIECSENSAWVFYASALGEVRAYDGDGDLAWIAVVDDFIWPDVRELENDGFAVRSQVHSSRLVGLTLLDDGIDEALLVQVSQRQLQDEGWTDETRLDSYLLDPRSGGGGFVGSALPRVVDAQPGMIATLTDVEYPRITLLATNAF